MARSLADAGIEAVLIPDSGIFAVMSRMSKVVLDTHIGEDLRHDSKFLHPWDGR
jgi:translation initiation factor 2B subunit (eIF-2B alpha/beta/delta family)